MWFGRGGGEDSMSIGTGTAKPIFLKAGLAVFVTLAGFFAARHRLRYRSPSSRPPQPYSHSDAQPEPAVATLEEELPICQTALDSKPEETLANIVPWAPVTVEEDQFSISSESSGEEFPRIFIPGFNKLVQTETNALTKTLPSTPMTNGFEPKDVSAMEEEIIKLKALVESLQDRENYLEMQLLELHGLKEQEMLFEELQNRLKISSNEKNLLSVKIESLQAENEKLRATVSDYSSVAAELAMQRKKFIVLKNEMDAICKGAKEKLAAVHIKIAELTEREKKNLEDGVRVEKQLKRLNELEDEVMKLQEKNSRLSNENTELMKRLSSEQIIGHSIVRSPDFTKMNPELSSLEKLNQLTEENIGLKKGIEQLQTDRCAEIEELVYLRWVNACLRYELKNYQLPPGKTISRDLSRSLSHNSEEKLKQLIVEYSNTCFNLYQNNLTDFNFDDCSSQESSEESWEPSLGSSKLNMSKPKKSKFIGKLKKLMLGKSRTTDAPSSDGNSDKKTSTSTCTMNEVDRKKAADKRKGSLDIDSLRRMNLEGVHERMSARSKSDLGDVYGRRMMISERDQNISFLAFDSFLENEEGRDPERAKREKFANVFKNSRSP